MRPSGDNAVYAAIMTRAQVKTNIEGASQCSASLNFARFAQADHGETDGGEIAERAQGFNVGAQVLDFGHGERCVVVADAQGALADVDQTVLVANSFNLRELSRRMEHPEYMARSQGLVGPGSY